MTLEELRSGEECEVVDVISDGVVGQRLLDMGFIPGTRIRVVRNAPLVDPVEFLMKGYHVSLRHSEARLVEVTPV
ncbi:MAG: ferrous iron transport protein A [Syntrophobacteria bacterium]